MELSEKGPLFCCKNFNSKGLFVNSTERDKDGPSKLWETPPR
jgi:hypothetical protein